MERNQFDEKLSREMQRLDESFIPDFDKEQVWRNSVDRKKIRFTYGAAAAVAAVLLFAYLIRPQNIAQEKKPASGTAALVTRKANTDKGSARESAPAEVYRSPEFERKKVQGTVKNKAASAEVKADSQIINPPERLLTAIETNPLSVQDSTEFKVTFKRGKPAAQPEVKVVYAKGKRTALKLRINPWADTTAYYVNENSHNRLNFKF